MSLDKVKNEVVKETLALRTIADIKNITTEKIATQVQLSRNTVSQYLNELLKSGAVVQVKSRPANFFDRETFTELFFKPQTLIYSTLAALTAEQSATQSVFQSFIGSQESMRIGIEHITTAINYPPNGLPMIFSGSTGVGKSYLAKLTYDYCVEKGILSEQAPFMTLNCAQYYHNPELLSSNLFGYAKGSFTGATTDFKGLLESADGGVLFLDECHRLDPESQEKLFSFMDTGTFQRMGENNVTRRANVRLIFATTEDLNETFLKTFMRRIPVSVKVPDLNNRSKTELKLHIFKAFIQESERLGRPITVSAWVINRLYNLKYKSNVGELKTNIRLLCARVFSQEKTAETIVINSESIGNTFLTNLMASKEQEVVVKEAVNFSPTSQLTDFEDQLQDENSLLLNGLQKILGLVEQYQQRTLSLENVKRQLAREAAALIDRIVHGDQQFQDESLKYMTAVIQGLFDYLESSFFVKIKGNAIVAIANYIYRKNDFEIKITPKETILLERLLGLISENAGIETQLLKSFLDLVKTKLDFKLDLFSQVLLMGYLISLEIDYQRSGQSAIILAHGFSTASSIADVANQFLDYKVFDAFDMPLSISVNQVREFMDQYLKKYDCSKGLVILVDMGSLMVLPESLEEVVDGPLLVISNVSTQEALYVGELIRSGTAIDEIGRKVQEKLRPTYRLSYPIVKKAPMIITTCHTGVGSAKQIQKFLENSMPQNLDYRIEAVDYAYLTQYADQSPYFNQYDVVSIVGTSDPQIPGMPFISLEKLVSTGDKEIVHQIFPTIEDSTVLDQINDKLIQNMSIERLLSAVTILDVKKVIESVSQLIGRLEEGSQIKLSNNQKAILYVHISALIERLIRNEKPLEYHPDNEAERVQGLQQIARALGTIESSYGINVSDGERNYLYDIIFEGE
ncbi:transcriptional regulator [Latilactobacillus sakei]|nr:sigma 54-interacting transcriptional regulator [Latilactobacillus sakei]AUX11705.1 transcriptional regulator [Latilactobacillus sakei]